MIDRIVRKTGSSRRVCYLAPALAGFVSWLAMGAPAQAADWSFDIQFDTPPSSTGVAVHPAIAANADHILADVWGGANWGWEGTITEIEKGGGKNDRLQFKDVKLLHKVGVPGHAGEVANTKKIEFKNFNIQAGRGKMTKAVCSFGPIIPKAVGHAPSHFDLGILYGVVNLSANRNDISSYTLISLAFHPDEGKRSEDDVNFGSGQLEPSGLAEDVYGGVAWLVEPSNGNFYLSLAASGILLGDVVEAQIRQGTPDAPGGVILDLGPASFVDMDGYGVARLIDDGQFPLAYVDDLITNNTFLEIVTPSGSLVGRLLEARQPIPTVSEWGMVVMTLLVLTVGTLVYMRRRAAWA